VSSMVDAVLTRFREHLVHDLTARWDMVQSSASEELLMSAYLDPRTKHFEFVKDQEKRDEQLARVQRTAKERMAEVNRAPADLRTSTVRAMRRR